MATISYDASATGRGGGGQPIRAFGDGPRRVLSGTFAFDSSYPTGGESIADIYSAFKTCLGVIFEATDGTRLFRVDHANQKVLAYTGLGAQVANTTDLSAVTGIRWIAYGN